MINYKAVQDIVRNEAQSVMGDDLKAAEFQVHEDNKFLVQLTINHELSEKSIENYRKEIGGKMQSIYKQYSDAAGWMVLFLLGGEVVESVYSALDGSSEYW